MAVQSLVVMARFMRAAGDRRCRSAPRLRAAARMQPAALVQRRFVVAQVGLRQAQRHVGVEVVQVGGERAAGIDVQAGLAALRRRCAARGRWPRPLLLDLPGAHRAAGLRQRVDEAVEQHLPPAVRRGARDAGLDADLAVRVGEVRGSGRWAWRRSERCMVESVWRCMPGLSACSSVRLEKRKSAAFRRRFSCVAHGHHLNRLSCCADVARQAAELAPSARPAPGTARAIAPRWRSSRSSSASWRFVQAEDAAVQAFGARGERAVGAEHPGRRACGSARMKPDVASSSVVGGEELAQLGEVGRAGQRLGRACSTSSRACRRASSRGRCRDSRVYTDDAPLPSFSTSRSWLCRPTAVLSPCSGPPVLLAASYLVCVRM